MMLMPNEALLWKKFKRLMQGERVSHLERVEAGMPKGLPDVHYIIKTQETHKWPRCICGWIELKSIKEWPKRENTKVRVDHFKKEQRLWLWNYGRAGGRAFILLHVKDTYFLLDWRAAFSIGKWKKDELIYYALEKWNDEEVLNYNYPILESLIAPSPQHIPEYFYKPPIIHL